MPIRIDFFAILILLGVIQGILLGGLFLTGERAKIISNRVMGWLMLMFAAAILEIFLCYTNYQFQLLWTDNYAEPTNFLLGLLPYFFVFSRLHWRLPKGWRWHLLPFAFWCVYSIFWQYQSLDYKYNSYINAWHHELPYRAFTFWLPDDPLRLRDHINDLTLISIFIYTTLCLREVYQAFQREKQPFFTLKNLPPLTQLRNYTFFICLFPVVFLIVKLIFEDDLGDYWLGSLVTLTIYVTSFLVMNHSILFKADPTENKKKYEKSALSEDYGSAILQKLQTYLAEQKPYLENDLTLPKLAQRLSVSPHHLSQVLNDRLNQSFFDWLAACRIEEAKKLLADTTLSHLKIDEIAERVGYNSTSAFHTAFKRITGKTPAQFRAIS